MDAAFGDAPFGEQARARSGVGRRTALGWGAAALAGVSGLTGCSFGKGAAAVSAGGWLADVAAAIGMQVAVNLSEEALHGLWSSWHRNVQDRLHSVSETGYDWYGNQAFFDGTPPAILVSLSKAQKPDGATDGLLACVNGGKDAVVFPTWARDGLGRFVHDLVDGRKGADLARYQTQAMRGLIPSGVRPTSGNSPKQGAGWMTYTVHDGWVEIVKVAEEGGTRVTVTSSAIPDADYGPTKKTYDIDEPKPSVSA